jgi:hypothetical protein
MSLEEPRSLYQVDTVYSACSVECCPQDSRISACGTYQVVEPQPDVSTESSPKTERLGRCLLYQKTDDDLLLDPVFSSVAVLSSYGCQGKNWIGSKALLSST